MAPRHRVVLRDVAAPSQAAGRHRRRPAVALRTSLPWRPFTAPRDGARIEEYLLSTSDSPTTAGSSGSLRRSSAGLRRLILPVLALALSAAAIAAVVTQQQPTTYRSSVTMVVQTSAGASDTDVLVRTMIALVGSEVVGEALREQVNSALAADEISDKLTVERPPGSSVLTVSYEDEDRERSIAVARAIIPVFQEQVTLLEVDQAGQLAPNYAIQPWGQGTVITVGTPPPILRNAAVAGLLGMLAGAIGAVLYRQRNRLVGDRRDAEEATALPVLTTLPMSNRRPGSSPWHPTDLMDGVVGRLPEALGTTQMPRRVLVVGPDKGRQRAAFVTHLARAMGDGGSEVTIVDADLESGSLSRRLGLFRKQGLAECLREDLPPAEAVVVPDDGLAEGLPVLAAGRKLPVRSGSAAVVLSSLTATQLVIDGPSPSGHQSLGPLVRGVDAVLVLLAAGRTTVNEATTLTSLIRSLGTAPVATILLTDSPDQAVRPTAVERSLTRARRSGPAAATS